MIAKNHLYHDYQIRKVAQLFNMTREEFKVYDSSGDIITVPVQDPEEFFEQHSEKIPFDVLFVVDGETKQQVEKYCDERFLGYISDRHTGRGKAEICYIRSLDDGYDVRL